jgi:hypothetical protein
MATGGKLHLRGRTPFGHLTVCGRPIEGRESEIVGHLDQYARATCQSCWRMRSAAAPVVGRKRTAKVTREET